MNSEKNIYTLKLHEAFTLNNGISILRVPGGWLYDMWDTEKDLPKTGVFIPFNNEYQIVMQVNHNENTQ